MDYVSNLRPTRYIYEEEAQTHAIAYKFQEKIGNFAYVTDLSSNMH